MAEMDLAPTKDYDAYDKTEQVNTSGMFANAEKFSMSATLHYHDICQGMQRIPGAIEQAAEQGEMTVRQSIREQGAAAASSKEFLNTLQTPEGRSKMQSQMQQDAQKMLGQFCLAADGVEITHVTTPKH